MFNPETFESHLKAQRISRRSFLQYCSAVASILALPPGVIPALAENLRKSVRPPVIWLSFQECTGCTESLTRSHAPTLEDLIFNFVSLDYHHTIQAASGEDAEEARKETIGRSFGKYFVIVDGSVPVANGGVYSTVAGQTNLELLKDTVAGAAIVIAVGSCAAFGGIAAANPNPTDATGVFDLMERGLIPGRPLINLPGCPPLPIAISGVLAHVVAFGRFPELDDLRRPLSIYGHTVHERCSRLHFYRKKSSHNDSMITVPGKVGAFSNWGVKAPSLIMPALYTNGTRGPVSPSNRAIPALGVRNQDSGIKEVSTATLRGVDAIDSEKLSGDVRMRRSLLW